jgi:hypothetical protein
MSKVLTGIFRFFGILFPVKVLYCIEDKCAHDR